MARVLVPLPDTDFDPTETAAPWHTLTQAGHEVVFATEGGRAPACDPLLLTGVVLGQLGARPRPKDLYAQMIASKECRSPITWKAIGPGDYDMLVLPGGHAQGMKQYLASEELREKDAYVEDEVKAALGDAAQYERGPITLLQHGTADDDRGAFVVEDGPYVSARWPGDAFLFAKRLLARL